MATMLDVLWRLMFWVFGAFYLQGMALGGLGPGLHMLLAILVGGSLLFCGIVSDQFTRTPARLRIAYTVVGVGLLALLGRALWGGLDSNPVTPVVDLLWLLSLGLLLSGGYRFYKLHLETQAAPVDPA